VQKKEGKQCPETLTRGSAPLPHSLPQTHNNIQLRKSIGVKRGVAHVVTTPRPLLLLAATPGPDRPHLHHMRIEMRHGLATLQTAVKSPGNPRAVPRKAPKGRLLGRVAHGAWLGVPHGWLHVRPVRGVLLRDVGWAGLLVGVVLRGVGRWGRLLRAILADPDPLTSGGWPPAGRSPGGCGTPLLNTPPGLRARGGLTTPPPPARRYARMRLRHPGEDPAAAPAPGRAISAAETPPCRAGIARRSSSSSASRPTLTTLGRKSTTRGLNIKCTMHDSIHGEMQLDDVLQRLQSKVCQKFDELGFRSRI
jgi:hypothetical protein